MVEDPRSFFLNVKRLKGRPEWSLRVGDRRALLRVDKVARLLIKAANDRTARPNHKPHPLPIPAGNREGSLKLKIPLP